jgi:hypothetical protein
MHITPLPSKMKFFDIDNDGAVNLFEFARALLFKLPVNKYFGKKVTQIVTRIILRPLSALSLDATSGSVIRVILRLDYSG